MTTEHRARITWSAEQVRRGLPEIMETIDPAWFEGTTPKKGDGWSLVCRFDSPPIQQGNPSTARVRFMVDDAPHGRLGQGARLQLFERGTGELAVVEVLE